MAEKKFIPVKVTDREWAEKLLDGEVFMRPLYEFGAWNLKKEDKQLNNSFRGDLCEGMSGIFGEVEECPIYDSFDENVKKYIKQIWYIDDTDIKYFKIFSLYCILKVHESNLKITMCIVWQYLMMNYIVCLWKSSKVMTITKDCTLLIV